MGNRFDNKLQKEKEEFELELNPKSSSTKNLVSDFHSHLPIHLNELLTSNSIENFEKNATLVNIYSSISFRMSYINQFLHDIDAKAFSRFLDNAFANEPSLFQVNFIILTLLQISEDLAFTWEEFTKIFIFIYEYIQKWNKEELSQKFYQKVVLEMLPVIDYAYKVKKGNDISFLFTLMNEIKDQTQNAFAFLKYLPVPPKFKKKCLEELFDSILHRVNFAVTSTANKTDSLYFQYLNEFKNLLSQIKQRKNILKSLKKCRFDKSKFNKFLSHSIILGSDNGIYVLLNTLSEREQHLILRDSHINPEVINSIMTEKGKIVIGEGSFGKIRMAMAIIPNKKSESSLIGGNIICVKKAGSKKKYKEKQEIWESTWNDYCSIDFLDDAPEIFDMKITKDCHNSLQGYCFQRLLMLPNGNVFYKNEEYQKWVHVKQYFIGIFRLMIKLHEKGICMTDLKPANTLYDKKTRAAKLVDLAGAVRNENLHSCKIKHVKEATPKYTAPELRDQIINDSDDLVDLTKSISWTVGQMLLEISKRIQEFNDPRENDKIIQIKNQIDLLINDLMSESPCERISLEEGLAKLMNIPELEGVVPTNFENYVNILKNNINTENSNFLRTLNLKNDIYILKKCFNEKLKITARNPEKYVYDPSIDESISDLLPAMRKMLQIDKSASQKKEVIVLFGPAGSGKSTFLQKIFIEAAQSWKIGDPIPIFMNLAIQYDFKDYWKMLQDYLDFPDLEFEDLSKSSLFLCLDSLDESRMDMRIISNIFNLISSYANLNAIKMLVTCRTGYFDEEKEEKKLNEKIKFCFRYIIPLNNFFFTENSNLEELIRLYLRQWEKRNEEEEINSLVSDYMAKIIEFRLKEMMKTTYIIFMILNIMPKLMKNYIHSKNISLLNVYLLYLEKNIENEILRSDIEAIRNKDVSWFMKIGVLLAEKMMLTKKATNQLKKKKTIKFLLDPLLEQIGERFNQKHSLIENISIYNVLRTLNLNIHLEKQPPNEEITLSFPHDTIKNFFLTRGFAEKLLSQDAFPEWISQRLITDDQNLILFMLESIKSSSKLASLSEMAIFSTKNSNDSPTIIRAANLITFLVASNYSFYGKDLSNIKIKGANISDGIFSECNFDNADLSNVILNNAKLNRASFLNTNLENVLVDIYPYFDGHTDAVNSVAFSSDGKKVVSGSRDKTLRVWDVESGKQLKKYDGHTDYVNSVAFSFDGKQIASGSRDKTVRIWDMESGIEFKTYKGHTNYVRSVAFSYNGKKIVSGSADQTVRIWDIENGSELRKLEGHTNWVTSVSFSVNGKKVISGSVDKTIRIWDSENGKELKKFEGHNSYVKSVAFSTDGNKIVSGGDDKMVIIWDLESGKELKKLEGHTGYVKSVAFSADGKKVVSGSDDKTVRIWDLKSGKEQKKYEGHLNYVTSVAYSLDEKKIVSGSADRTIRIWDVESRNELKKYEGHTGIVKSVAFSCDGKKVVSGSGDKTVRIWDSKSGKELKEYKGHSDCVNSVAFSYDGTKLVSGSADRTVRIWDSESGKELRKYEGHFDNVKSVAFSYDGQKVLSGSDDKTVIIWDVESGKQVQKYEGHTKNVTSVAFSFDGEKVISGSRDKTMRSWDVKKGIQLKKYEGHSNWVTSVSFSYDGKNIVSGSDDKTVRIWDVESEKTIKMLQGHTNWIISVDFSYDGKTVVSGSADKTIRIWNIESGEELKKYVGYSNYINSVAFSLDGKQLVIGSDKCISFYFPLTEDKNPRLIISPSATAFSCYDCINYEKSRKCSNRLLSLFKQRDSNSN